MSEASVCPTRVGLRCSWLSTPEGGVAGDTPARVTPPATPPATAPRRPTQSARTSAHPRPTPRGSRGNAGTLRPERPDSRPCPTTCRTDNQRRPWLSLATPSGASQLWEPGLVDSLSIPRGCCPFLRSIRIRVPSLHRRYPASSVSGRRRRVRLPSRWPPSAAQTERAVFPHSAFTKARYKRRRIEGISAIKRTRPNSP